MKHYSKKFLYYRLAISILISLLYSFVFILSALSSSEDEESFQLQDYLIYIIAGFVVIYMFLAIYNIIFFKISTYEIKDNEIICKKGVLVRKKSFLEYEKWLFENGTNLSEKKVLENRKKLFPLGEFDKKLK